MNRPLLVTAGVALALVPAVFGLTDNPSLSHRVPVRIPSGAVPVTEHQIDDSAKDRRGTDDSDKDGQGAAATPDKDDKGGQATPAATASPDKVRGLKSIPKTSVSGPERTRGVGGTGERSGGGASCGSCGSGSDEYCCSDHEHATRGLGFQTWETTQRSPRPTLPYALL